MQNTTRARKPALDSRVINDNIKNRKLKIKSYREFQHYNKIYKERPAIKVSISLSRYLRHSTQSNPIQVFQQSKCPALCLLDFIHNTNEGFVLDEIN